VPFLRTPNQAAESGGAAADHHIPSSTDSKLKHVPSLATGTKTSGFGTSNLSPAVVRGAREGGGGAFIFFFVQPEILHFSRAMAAQATK
jgi:hypothetical protein